MPDIDERTVRFGDRERDTTSYARADTSGVLICHKTSYLFAATYFGGGDEHLVLLYRDGREWRGGCDCNRWHYDGRQTGRPCAHLWAVKRANETIDDFDLSRADAALTENLNECPTCERTTDGRHEPNAQDPEAIETTQCRQLHTDGTIYRRGRRWHASPAVVDIGSVSVPSRPSTREVHPRCRSRGRGTPHLHLRTTHGGSRTLYRPVETKGFKSPNSGGRTSVSTACHSRPTLCHTTFHQKRRLLA